MKKRAAVQMMFSVLLLSSCNYNLDKTSETIVGDPAADKQVSLVGFETVYDSVFSKSCTECHSSKTFAARGISLDSYQSVLPHLAAIDESVATSRMPKNRPPLTAQQKELLRNWIAAGAPENALSDPQSPSPVPTPPTLPAPKPDPIPPVAPAQPPPDIGTPAPAPPPAEQPAREATFELIREKILAPRCLACHSSAANVAGVDLETFESLTTVLKRVQRAVKQDSMPPGNPLSEEQKSLLLKWIENGAPQ